MSFRTFLRLYEGMTGLMDKGFMMQAEMASVVHECLTPMKKWPKQWSFTVDDLAWNTRIGRLRVLIENAFKRAQEWKILHKIVKVSMSSHFYFFFICLG